MTLFIKNILAIIYLNFVKLLFNNKSITYQRNILFINSEKIGDLIISSEILNNKVFPRFDNVYFLIKSEYSDLFKNYKGNIRFITFNKHKFLFSLTYNLDFVKFLKGLKIKEVYNISQARGQINEILANIPGSHIKYATNNDPLYLGSFYHYWNKKYKSIIFAETLNEYVKIEKLMQFISVSVLDNNTNIFINTHYPIKLNYIPIIIAPYSSSLVRDWGVHNYCSLISKINKNNKILILTSTIQKIKAIKDFGFLKNVVVNDTGLANVANILKVAKLFIGNDSGLTHFAIKLKVKTVAIIGGGTFGRYFPVPKSEEFAKYYYYKMDCFNCNWKCIYKEPYCHKYVKVEDVLTYIENEGLF